MKAEGLPTINYGERGRVHIVADPAELAHAAAERFIAATSAAVASRGIAFVALSGGSTPKAMGNLLAQPAYGARVPWDNVHVFWGDERWVPLDSPESNAGEAKRAFLDLVGIPAANVHPFLTTGVDPDSSASAYESLIRATLDGDPPVFDLIFLGMGDDGHTASLFPGTAAIHEQSALVVAHFVDKLNVTRLTMTPPLLNAARDVVFLAAGAGKASKLSEVLDGTIDVDTLPSQVIRPAGGPDWLVDLAAIANLARQPE